jgi:hypothetical protein
MNFILSDLLNLNIVLKVNKLLYNNYALHSVIIIASNLKGMVWPLTWRFQKYFHGMKVMSSDEQNGI